MCYKWKIFFCLQATESRWLQLIMGLNGNYYKMTYNVDSIGSLLVKNQLSLCLYTVITYHFGGTQIINADQLSDLRLMMCSSFSYAA